MDEFSILHIYYSFSGAYFKFFNSEFQGLFEKGKVYRQIWTQTKPEVHR